MSSGDTITGPRVLFVYFTYTQQTLLVAKAMAETLRERGCEARLAAIELTDTRYAERFTRFPLRHPYGDILGMMPAQLRGATGDIRISDDAQQGAYDLVVVGSPTWWLRTSVPIRSFLKSEAAGQVFAQTRFAAFVVCRRYWGFNLRSVAKLGTARGGQYVDGIHFSFAGGQIRSLLSLISYFGTGENRERYLGVRIPPTNLQAAYLEQARTFANGLADGLLADVKNGSAQLTSSPPTRQPNDLDTVGAP